MCYASRVMLKGRCSCAISGRPTPSSFASSSLLRPLTPLFPLHPRNSPVTPLFPLLTQKQGGRGVADPSKLMIFATDLLCLSSTGDFNRLEDSAQDFELSTFNLEPPFSPKSNDSRTYARHARKSNHSRTYAKTGGWGWLSAW
jgi:hypothetical protein